MLPISLSRAIQFCALLLISLAVFANAYAKSTIIGDLPRRADLGFQFTSTDHLVVTAIDQASAAYKAGLREGDTIVSINGKAVADNLRAARDLRRVAGGLSLALQLERSDEVRSIRFTPSAKALESIPGVVSEYTAVAISDAVKLRSIVSYPKGTKNALPALFFVQWVSCASLEYNPKSTFSRVQERLTKETQRTLIRVERASDGDSHGPACHELDYDTELQHYYHAFLTLKNHPKVDASNIVIYGSSLGSTLAPLLAEKLIDNGHAIAGVMIQGGGALTYFERMLQFERIYLERKKNDGVYFEPASIHTEFLNRSMFFSEYLIRGRHPDHIAKDSEVMASVRKSIRGLSTLTHYGRPFAWHQQAAKNDFLKAWHKIQAPVLVVYNEFDQFETRHGHKVIVDMVNRWRPGTATFVEQKAVGHSNYRYASAEDAYNYVDGESTADVFADHLISWLRKVK